MHSYVLFMHDVKKIKGPEDKKVTLTLIVNKALRHRKWTPTYANTSGEQNLKEWSHLTLQNIEYFFAYAFVFSQCRLELRVTPMAYLPPTLYGEERAVRNILECFLVRRIKHVHVGFAKWNEGGDTAKDRSMFATWGYTQIYRLICGPLHHSYYQQITKPLDDLTQIYTSTHQASLIRATLYMGIMRNAHITFGVGWLGSRESSCAYLYKARCPWWSLISLDTCCPY